MIARNDVKLESALERMLVVFQVAGQFPILINKGVVTAPKWMATYAVLMTTIIPIMCVVLLLDYPLEMAEPVLKTMIISEFVPAGILLILSPLWLLCNRKSVDVLIQSLRCIEGAGKYELVHKHVDKYFVEMVLVVIILFAAGVARWRVIIRVAGPNVEYALATHFTRCLLIVLTSCQFVGFCSILSSMFGHLVTKIDSVIGVRGLESLARSYERIVDGVEAVERLYSPQLLLIFFCVFVEINFNLFMAAFKSGGLTQAVTLTIWATFCFAACWWIIDAADSVRRQADKFYSKYRSLIKRSGLDDYVPLNATLYIFAIRRTEISFTASGSLTLNKNLLFSMVMATTTFVITLKSL